MSKSISSQLADYYASLPQNYGAIATANSKAQAERERQDKIRRAESRRKFEELSINELPVGLQENPWASLWSK